jgi:hypothetical protein
LPGPQPVEQLIDFLKRGIFSWRRHGGAHPLAARALYHVSKSGLFAVAQSLRMLDARFEDMHCWKIVCQHQHRIFCKTCKTSAIGNLSNNETPSTKFTLLSC